MSLVYHYLLCYRGQKRCLTPLRYVHKIVGIGTHPKNASRILWRRDNKPCKVFLRTRSTIPTVATPTKFGREHDFFTVTSENASCSLNIVRHFFCNSRFLTPVAWHKSSSYASFPIEMSASDNNSCACIAHRLTQYVIFLSSPEVNDGMSLS